MRSVWKKQIITLCVSLIFLLIQINSSVIADQKAGDLQTKNIAKWTYMAYVSWDTSLGKIFNNDTINIMQSLQRVGSNDELNIVVLLDVKEPEDKTSLLYVLKNDTIDCSWHEQDSNMGNKDTLVEFVKRAENEFPAERYSLIMLSPRGMSWQGLCKDDDINKCRTQSQLDATYIDMNELDAALREITNNGREKIDIIGFSTCITGSLEVAYQIAPYVNYMVASEQNMQSFTSNPRYTWPIYKSLSALKNNTDMTGEEFAKCTVDNFVAGKNTDAYLPCWPKGTKVNIPINTTLSAVNLSRINNVAVAVNNLATSLIDNTAACRDDIKEARDEAKKFGVWYPRTRLGYFAYHPYIRKTMTKLGIPYFMDVWIDLYHFSELLCTKIDPMYPDAEKIIAACHEVINTMDYTVIANNVVPGDNSHGLHIYFPPNAYRHNQHLWPVGFPNILISRKAHAPYEALDFAKATQWNELLYKQYRIPDILVKLWIKQKLRIL